MANIKLRSSDGKIFNVKVKVARCSSLIKIKLDERDEKQVAAEEPIELKVRGAILEKAIEWMEQYYKDDAQAQSPNNYVKNEWDINFLKTFENQTGELFELVKAANYLSINGLLNLTCCAVGDLMKGKTPTQIRNVVFID